MTTEIKTPSQTIIEKSNSIHEITDATGRPIKIKKPDILDEVRLLEIVGDYQSNPALMGIYSLLMYVISVDNLPFCIGTTKNELNAALKRLERHGLKAVQDGILKFFKEDLVENTEESKEEVKK